MSFAHYSIRALTAAGLILAGAACARADAPAFVKQSLQRTGIASIASVQETAYGDFFVISGGAHDGYRRGVVLQVVREREAIAEILLVHVGDTRSAALLKDLRPGTAIREGDRTYFKTLSNS